MGKKITVQQPGEPVNVTVDVPEGSGVRMKRNEEQFPPAKYGPSTADVHADEVLNWAKHGWELDTDYDGAAE